MTNVVIFDLDGCLFDDRWRLPLIRDDLDGEAKWDQYHAQIAGDSLFKHSAEVLNSCQEAGVQIAFITARPNKYRDLTVSKIKASVNPISTWHLYMREDGDLSHAPAVKAKVLETFPPAVNIIGAFDDRADILEMYSLRGIKAFKMDENGPFDLLWSGKADEWTVNESHRRGPPAKPFNPSSPHWNISEILNGAAATFDERQGEYGRSDLMYGKVMAVLFPEGLLAKTPDEHRQAMFVMHAVGKLCRLASSGFQHQDSAHDLINYAAFIEATIGQKITPIKD